MVPPLGAAANGQVYRERGDEHRELRGHQRVTLPAGGTNPLSTFSIDVDTASYTNVRRFLTAGAAPAEGRGADRGDGQLLPLRLSRAATARTRSRHHRGRGRARGRRSTGWCASASRAARSAREPAAEQPGLPARRLRLDEPPNKLPLVKEAFRLLVEELRPERPRGHRGLRRRAGLVLPSTPGIGQGDDPRGARPAAGRRLDQRRRRASSWPTTWRRQHFIQEGNNRVILAPTATSTSATSPTRRWCG